MMHVLDYPHKNGALSPQKWGHSAGTWERTGEVEEEGVAGLCAAHEGGHLAQDVCARRHLVVLDGVVAQDGDITVAEAAAQEVLHVIYVCVAPLQLDIRA